MPKVRHFAIRGTATNCAYCEAMGFSAQPERHQETPEFVSWLETSGYSHVVFGCGADGLDMRFEAYKDSSLKAIFVRHSLSTFSEEHENWLVAGEVIPEAFATASPPKFILMPKKSNTPLNEQLRAIPESLSDRFFLQWPHPSMLSRWGWKWSELLLQQTYLGQSFPYLKWHLPHGWDAFNPDVDRDLSLEPRPESIVDRRAESFQPQVSIIIPTYNNLGPLKAVLRQALRSEGSFEIVVADDGSDDGTREFIASAYADEPRLVYLHIARPRRRKMGQGGFRAGIARNVATTQSRGRILLFVDSDILIPVNYVEELIRLHESYDLIQATRLQLKFTVLERPNARPDELGAVDVVPGNEAWESFQARVRPWDELASKWKFASTFCLSIKREEFDELGGFRRSFNKYGFEDTDLGYRAAQAGLKFYRSRTSVYHFKHCEGRSEYRHNLKKKKELLRDSARVFFINNPNSEIYNAIPEILR